MKCKYEGSGVWEGRCTGTRELDPCPGHSKCSRFCGIHQTNADLIRSMSDEELAIFLGGWADRALAWMRDDLGECLYWLQQPADHFREATKTAEE